LQQPVSLGCSWSGGKDSCFALMQRLKQGAVLKVLINMMNENGKISRSHGLPEYILQQQSIALGVPLLTRPSTWNDYEHNFISMLDKANQEYGVNEIVFGDIDLQGHRDWEEKVCNAAGLNCSLPLWKMDRKQLVVAMIDSGLEAVIVSCNTVMGESFLGRKVNHELVHELESLGVDVCGENGEFHTVVVNCPLFNQRIQLPSSEKVLHESYWFLTWPDHIG
jgi:diphthine-ammonia ligase